MKPLAILVLNLFALATYGQEITSEFDGHQWEAPYHLPIPNDWTIERFLIPISFAPQIPYRGVEDIRFAPGWGMATSDEYWSYAFLWYLDGEVKTNARVIGSNLQAYYTGLLQVNGSNGQDSSPAPSLLKKRRGNPLLPVSTSFRKVKKEKGDLKSYVGTITMLDYMSQKPIILNCKVHLGARPARLRHPPPRLNRAGHTFIFFQLSPQPLSHDIWQSLDQLWSDFRCEKT